MRRLMWVLLMGWWLAACAPVDPAPQSTVPPETAAPTGPAVSTAVQSTADLPATPPSERDAVIVFERGGGLMGTYQQWTIYADGTIALADGPEGAALEVGQVSAGQVAALVTGLESLGFFEMQPAYGVNDDCADCFLYSVTVTRGGVTKTVTTHDAASDAPPELAQALELIQALLNTTT